jgi:hypothetical protein
MDWIMKMGVYYIFILEMPCQKHSFLPTVCPMTTIGCPCSVLEFHVCVCVLSFIFSEENLILFCFVSNQGKQQQILSHSPKTRMTGFSVASSQGSPSDSPGLNRWFKPEVDTPSSIRSIQIEEKAIKDLKRFYSSVKVVKNQS